MIHCVHVKCLKRWRAGLQQLRPTVICRHVYSNSGSFRDTDPPPPKFSFFPPFKPLSGCLTLTYVCVCRSVVQTGTWTPRSPSPWLAPPPPSGNGCNGSSVLCGFCSASHRLQRRTDVRLLKRLLALLFALFGQLLRIKPSIRFCCHEIIT